MTDPIIVTRSCPYCDWGMEVSTTSSLFALARRIEKNLAQQARLTSSSQKATQL